MGPIFSIYMDMEAKTFNILKNIFAQAYIASLLLLFMYKEVEIGYHFYNI